MSNKSKAVSGTLGSTSLFGGWQRRLLQREASFPAAARERDPNRGQGFRWKHLARLDPAGMAWVGAAYVCATGKVQGCCLVRLVSTSSGG